MQETMVSKEPPVLCEYLVIGDIRYAHRRNSSGGPLIWARNFQCYCWGKSAVDARAHALWVACQRAKLATNSFCWVNPNEVELLPTGKMKTAKAPSKKGASVDAQGRGPRRQGHPVQSRFSF